ncbi:uncharacterized protein LOC143564244 [Bidens hawaiensis]|uniref:uncharacterized protein LOC143564244 n=1 Tax=Bidens hawaiensis TaxID=980011 RepID=UPI0040496541
MCMNRDTVFLVCLVLLIAHIGIGKSAQLLGKVNIIGVIMMDQQLSLRLLHHLIFGYGMRFFGMPGANNDIVVINASPRFDRLVNGVGPDTSFSTNDVNYEYGYYLVDDIYPDWATLVHRFTCPTDDKRKNCKKIHESARKDIERAFGVLKKHWSIVRHPARIQQIDKLRNVMYTCIILHNMILEDSGRAICQDEYNDAPDLMTTLNEDEKFAYLLRTRKKETNFSLRSDLVEHVWRNKQENGCGSDVFD